MINGRRLFMVRKRGRKEMIYIFTAPSGLILFFLFYEGHRFHMHGLGEHVYRLDFF